VANVAEVEHGGKLLSDIIQEGKALALVGSGRRVLKSGEVLLEVLGEYRHIGAGVRERFKSHG
jgi:hypothetical protein